MTYTLLKQEAKARNIEVADAEVEQQLAVMKQEARSEEAFTKALADRKMTVERLRADARVELAIAKMMNAQVATAAAATDADAQGVLREEPGQVQARRIGARQPHPDPRRATRRRADGQGQGAARIDAVLKRARAGEDFAALAREHSQDGSAAQGGDLNYFLKGKMVQPFDQVAFTLKPSEISDVVTTSSATTSSRSPIASRRARCRSRKSARTSRSS